MDYLNEQCLNEISYEAFQKQRPYPWLSLQDSLTPEGFQRLRETLPDNSLFERNVGVKRAHGQASHDRNILHYQPHLKLAEPWKEFIASLQGESYQEFLHRIFGPEAGDEFILTFEWYYAWQGCSVSPHCDARRKLATHIFYFNTEADWDTNWGGQILMLDDEGRFNPHSAPTFDDFKVAATIVPRGNASLIFERTDHSWHGVRPLQCPPNTLRKLFIVTVNVPTMQVWWRRARGKDPDGYRIRAT
jgi:2OG-Fe(II) oxygenase superfamily